MDGVEGKRNVCDAGSRNAGTEVLDGDWSSLNGPDISNISMFGFRLLRATGSSEAHGTHACGPQGHFAVAGWWS
jgi:hypothetical protein